MFLSAAADAKAISDDLLGYIQSRSLGYVVARNMQETSDKLEQLAEPLGYSIPSPLSLAKLTIGLDAGLNSSGSLAIAFLPGNSATDELQPLVLLPISDYPAFARSIQADASGEACRVTLLGEDILVAKIGQYAILVNVDNQAIQQRLLDRQADPELDRESDPTAQVEPSASWLADQDAYLVLLPAGLQQLARRKTPANRDFIITEEEYQQSLMVSSWVQSLLGPELRSWFAANAKMVALGAKVDADANVKLSSQVVVKRSSLFSELTPMLPANQTAKLDIVDEPYVVSAGGPLPQGWGKELADYWSRADKDAAAINGLKNLPADLWSKKATSNRLLLEQVQSCSFVMLPGKKGEPLVGNFLGLITVPDASEYLNALPQVVETANEVTKHSTSDIKPVNELIQRKIAGHRCSELTIDYAATDDNVPITKWMVDAAFGSSGKLSVKFLRVDETRLLLGLATDEQMSVALERIEDGADAQKSSENEAALQLLNPAAPWKLLLQPQNCLDWAARVENEFLGLLMLNAQETSYPEMPDSPPLGFSLHYADQRWQMELACPAATWATLGKYVAHYDELE